MRASLFPLFLGQVACTVLTPLGDLTEGGPLAPQISTPDTGPAPDIEFSIDTSQDVHPISPYIYGINDIVPDDMRNVTLARFGMLRWSTYNWENNASNTGTYETPNNQNDDGLWGGDVPGEAIRNRVAQMFDRGASVWVTIPLIGRVAADKIPGTITGAEVEQRFHQTLARKGAPFEDPPNLNDRSVFLDEFVAWLEKKFPSARNEAQPTIFYGMDSEPDLWTLSLPLLQPSKQTYAGLMSQTTQVASAVKAVAKNALLFGPSPQNYSGFMDLLQAPDAQGRDFLDYYMGTLAASELPGGVPLVDVLDVHWWSEASSESGTRIVDGGNDPGLPAARVQAPRSLWDKTYSERSWITRDVLLRPIAFIPSLRDRIASIYPKLRMSFSLYTFGGHQDISGAIAQADALGIFGRERVFAATADPGGSTQSFVRAGFRMFRDFDGAGGVFGDTSVRTATSDVEKTSIYAAVDEKDNARLTAVLLNKTTKPFQVRITINHSINITRAVVFELSGTRPEASSAKSAELFAGNKARLELPAMSVSTVVFH